MPHVLMPHGWCAVARKAVAPEPDALQVAGRADRPDPPYLVRRDPD